MGSIHLLQNTLERLNEAKTEEKSIAIEQNRALLNLLQTLEKLNYTKILTTPNNPQ